MSYAVQKDGINDGISTKYESLTSKYDSNDLGTPNDDVNEINVTPNNPLKSLSSNSGSISLINGNNNDNDTELIMEYYKQPSMIIVHLVMIIANVSFGGGAVVGSLGLPSTNPVLFALIRDGIAGPILCVIAFALNRQIPAFKDIRLFLIPGFWLFVNQLTFTVGLKISSSITASAWQPSQGILAVIYGYILGTEKYIDCCKIFGIIIGVAGAVIMVLLDNHSESDTNSSLWNNIGGSVFFFINSSATALYLISSKPAFKKYQSTTVTGFSYIFASFLMAIVALTVAYNKTILNFVCQDCNGNAWNVPEATIYALIYWILFQSVLSYLCLTWANKYADPSVNLAYTVVQPLTAIIASEILILINVVPQCSTDKNANNPDNCLYSPNIGTLGSIGIIIGLYCVIYSDYKQRQIIKQQNIKRNTMD